MARILARFRDRHLLAAIDAGRFSHRSTRAELFRILLQRRRAILERFLTRLSPLTYPETRDNVMCLHDLALESRLRPTSTRRYEAQAWADWPREGTEAAVATRVGDRVCVEVPLFENASLEEPRYRVVDVVASSIARETTGPARVHMYQVGPRELRVVGLERPSP